MDAWTKGHEAVAIIDDLRKAGRVTLYLDRLVWLPREVPGWAILPGDTPEDARWRMLRDHCALDLEHPATKGILLAYVREAAGHVVTVEWSEPSKLLADARPDLTGEVWWVVDPRDDRTLATEATESGALVAALRALRDGGT